MMSAMYVAVTTPVVKTVREFQMVTAGKVTVAAYQQETQVMTVKTVREFQMVTAGKVTVAAYQQETQVMTVMTVLEFQMAVTLKITAVLVTVMLPMIALRIVLVHGAAA